MDFKKIALKGLKWAATQVVNDVVRSAAEELRIGDRVKNTIKRKLNTSIELGSSIIGSRDSLYTTSSEQFIWALTFLTKNNPTVLKNNFKKLENISIFPTSSTYFNSKEFIELDPEVNYVFSKLKNGSLLKDFSVMHTYKKTKFVISFFEDTSVEKRIKENEHIPRSVYRINIRFLPGTSSELVNDFISYVIGEGRKQEEEMNILRKRHQKLESDIMHLAPIDADGDFLGYHISKKAPKESNIILDKKLKLEIKKDAVNFVEKEKWFKDRNLVYKRGYLFYGPPGCGKSSFITRFASSFAGNRVTYINLNLLRTEKAFAKFVNNLQDDARGPSSIFRIFVFEDFDSCYDKRKIINPNIEIALETLLNFLDGYMSVDNTVVIFTVNDVSKLDPALVRPGRIDRKFEFKPASVERIKEFLDVFYDTSVDISLLEVDDDFTISYAELKNMCFMNMEDMNKVLEELKQLNNDRKNT